ncbi:MULTISPECIES: hypothetical protein [Bacillus]|uniref:hypothetical protein n=1 Tax=Bacillus TaxID=1386 RepID=UPI0015C83A49|nr:MULTISPECIES: hypothetical protein [Bacillus]MBT9285897.1 hypothetical protein [Bacillus velezensis]MCX2820249.1 hypothetical protein [Bacillus sp. H1F1]QZY34556.1 hypothetical protein BAJP3144_09280 [Bacillus amyloliquefaciens]
MKKRFAQALSYEDMAKGYEEMAPINLEISQEDNHLENEADMVRSKYKAKVS